MVELKEGGEKSSVGGLHKGVVDVVKWRIREIWLMVDLYKEERKKEESLPELS